MRRTTRTLDQRSSPIGAHAHLLAHAPADLELIDLSQGAPSFPPPTVVADRVAEVAHEVDGARYTPLLGLPELRLALADDVSAAYGAAVGADHVCITAGANQAFAAVASALAEAGDNIALVLPYYFNHDMWLGLDGLDVRYVRPSNGVTPSVGDVEAVVDERTRAITLVTPGNPTGAAISPDVLDAMADFAERRSIPIILDETYRSFVHGSEAPHRLFDRSNWADHVVSLHSFSKDFAMPGYRVGAIIGAPPLLDEVAKIIDCVTICPSRLGQEAALAALREAQDWRRQKVAEIHERQARFEATMSDRPGGFELLSAGAYYGWVRHPFDDRSSDDVVEQLILAAAVLTIPGTAFEPDDPQAIRCSFANATFPQLDALADRFGRLS